MLAEPAQVEPSRNGRVDAGLSRPPASRRRRPPKLVGALLLLVLAVGAISVALFRQQASSSTPATLGPAPAPLIAHGQILPARQARVGTQGGGVVQQLNVSPGDQTAAQAPLAWVLGPSGTEIVTAPYGGTVTNVLIHAGDTLLPGATIATVADLHLLQVETSDVDEFLVSNVAVGQRVQVSVDALDNLMLTGIVKNVALLPQPGTNGSYAYPVIVSIGGLPPEVRAGMSVRVTFPESS